MRYFIFSIFLISSLVFSFGCKTVKNAQKGKKQGEAAAASEAKLPLAEWETIVAECSKQNLQFQTISLTGKLSADMPEQGNIDANYRMNIMKDSMIWLKVSKLGMEGLRALITPTKIQVIDRLNSKVYLADFAKISKFAGIEVDFRALQDLLLGNIPNFPTKEVVLEKGEKENLLKFVVKGIDFNYTIAKENNKLSKVTTVQTAKNQNATLTYYDFEIINNQPFPHNVVLEAKAKSAINAEFRHAKVEVNPAEISFSFSIPEGYEVVKE